MVMAKMNSRKGQVTMFIIVAIVLIGVIFAFAVVPRIVTLSSDVNPSSFLRDCIRPSISEVKETLSIHGGYTDPTNYLEYQGERIQYLCYTNEDYIPCLVQQPLLIHHIEQEMKQYIEPKAKQCLTDLKKQYERQGYTVSSPNSRVNISVISGSIVVDFDAPLSVTKENTQTFRKFSVALNSNWYDLLATATSILQYESTLGDSETSLYISYYPNLRVDKTRRDEGSTVYRLSDVTSEDYFTFATRSLVWPQGLTSKK